MTDELGFERLKNDYKEIHSMQTNLVSIRTVNKPAGSLALIEVSVKPPNGTYYITGEYDTDPKPTEEIAFYIKILDGFPRTKPHVYYKSDKILAHVNTFKDGSQCIDEWFYDEEHSGNNSSLAGIVQKTVMAIIYDPAVTNYDSMANRDLKEWQCEMTSSGRFPLGRINTLLKLDAYDIVMPAIPVRKKPFFKKRRPSVPIKR